MKLLKDILYKVSLADVRGSTNIAVDAVTFDSRTAMSFGMFVAIRGTQVDGHNYIDSAIEAGAISVVCEELPENINEKITYVVVTNTHAALGIMASNFYDHPSHDIKLVGVTGTNGKTTTATLLYNLFRSLGYKAGLLSTVVNKIHTEVIPSTHTTPDALSLNSLLRDMVDFGCEYCFMEVSSHAISQHRITGLEFTGGVFTNITHEHLDYHGTFDAYIAAKKGFFDMLPDNAFALINRDDSHWEDMIHDTKAKVKTFGINSVPDFKAKIIENQFEGLHLNIDGNDLYSKLIGGFNAYNILTVYATAVLLGHDNIDVLTTISTLNSVEGRFEYMKTENDITAIVDYAHTPDALKNVLKTIEDIRNGNEQVISVVGCGGDRDATKRPLMAKIACDLSDRVFFTSDNPRTENPDKIIEDMKAGVDGVNFRKTLSITDRREAIRAACAMAQTGDIVLITGKGHEKYQEINGERLPFDDMQIVSETLKMLEK
jgi:UDP-N-acetylmuramoyl-L-alanyl-D-glutamate--2,6-diaminopimelate ligase